MMFKLIYSACSKLGKKPESTKEKAKIIQISLKYVYSSSTSKVSHAAVGSHTSKSYLPWAISLSYSVYLKGGVLTLFEIYSVKYLRLILLFSNVQHPYLY